MRSRQETGRVLEREDDRPHAAGAAVQLARGVLARPAAIQHAGAALDVDVPATSVTEAPRPSSSVKRRVKKPPSSSPKPR